MAVYFLDSSALVKRYITETPIRFVSADNELNAAIIAEGLTIENPNNPLS
ncbi:hypothetical protein DSM106972_014110 [Dulcicalothrix desertica PCC 7102]|uniref:PIN domain-containing protein n=1 Tax=Dulcicalothrix desertica PCC 7102 TaxID=232991 RepID=A0A3S1DDZ2_9CYAN|nr:hypothetical protein DSM106972_014110 [Dulcicalothrix desertica PCC 7102]TWH40113.1 hypothetical protein CAL7102_09410 [Dulcicalothrix desertica PCC 7102]